MGLICCTPLTIRFTELKDDHHQIARSSSVTVRRLPPSSKPGARNASRYIAGTSMAVGGRDDMVDKRVEAGSRDALAAKRTGFAVAGRPGVGHITKRFDGKEVSSRHDHFATSEKRTDPARLRRRNPVKKTRLCHQQDPQRKRHGWQPCSASRTISGRRLRMHCHSQYFQMDGRGLSCRGHHVALERRLSQTLQLFLRRKKSQADHFLLSFFSAFLQPNARELRRSRPRWWRRWPRRQHSRWREHHVGGQLPLHDGPKQAATAWLHLLSMRPKRSLDPSVSDKREPRLGEQAAFQAYDRYSQEFPQSGRAACDRRRCSAGCHDHLGRLLCHGPA